MVIILTGPLNTLRDLLILHVLLLKVLFYYSSLTSNRLYSLT
jgi:hypothetical protein